MHMEAANSWADPGRAEVAGVDLQITFGKVGDLSS